MNLRHIKSYYRFFKSFSKRLMGINKPINQVFTNIHASNFWGDSESVSGSGSNMVETNELMEILPVIFKTLNIKTILDIPCGDFNWMQNVNLLEIISYKGADIVHSLIEKNQRSNNRSNVSFEVLDLTSDVLPAVDLIFCRDCLVHLSNENIFQAIKNIKVSRTKYLLTTSFPDSHFNYNIVNGDWRPINLQIEPFKLNPVAIFKEREDFIGEFKDKSLLLFEVERL